MTIPVGLYANVCIIVICLAIALPAAASTFGADGASSGSSGSSGGSASHASHQRIPDLSVAISSVKFPGDVQWTYDRNVQAALAATSAAGPLPVPNFTTETIFH